jgi:hypothetical protein
VTWALESLIPLLGAVLRSPYTVSGTSPIICVLIATPLFLYRLIKDILGIVVLPWTEHM